MIQRRSMHLHEDVMIAQCGEFAVVGFLQTFDAILAVQDPGIGFHCIELC